MSTDSTENKKEFSEISEAIDSAQRDFIKIWRSPDFSVALDMFSGLLWYYEDIIPKNELSQVKDKYESLKRRYEQAVENDNETIVPGFPWLTPDSGYV